MLSCATDANPTPVRKTNAGEDIWKDLTYRKPSDRIQIVLRRKADDAPSSGGDAPGAGGGKDPQPTSQSPSATSAPTPPSPPTPAPTFTPQLTPAGAWPCRQVGQLIANYQGGSQNSADDEEWLRQVESKCKGALQQFQLQSKLLTKALTPNAALLKFQESLRKAASPSEIAFFGFRPSGFGFLTVLAQGFWPGFYRGRFERVHSPD